MDVKLFLWLQDLQQLVGTSCDESRTCRGCCFNQEQLSGPIWFKPSSLRDLYAILNAHVSESVKLVVGNTGTGNTQTHRKFACTRQR